MKPDIPTGTWQRGFTGGKTAAHIGSKTLRYLAAKPFLSREKREQAQLALNRETADLLFKSLSLLRGTALKLAQLFSLEMDLLPEDVCRELEKSYNRVPPLNAALVRRIIKSELGVPPEAAFQQFDVHAFAAASLGQVHSAVSLDGDALAVKIQYPGVEEAIGNDIRLVRTALRTLPDSRLLIPMLAEVETRLLEEVDYVQEAANTALFAERLHLEPFHVPSVFPKTSSPTILSQTFMDGSDLNTWLDGNPSQSERDRVAQALYNLFLYGLYELGCIHADPNPGNFIIQPNGGIALLDFGCVRRFTPEFVQIYRRWPAALLKGDAAGYIELLKELGLLPDNLPEHAEKDIVDVYYPVSRWFARLYRDGAFDFGKDENFFRDGRKLMAGVGKLRKHFCECDPAFVYLDRTRYGLLRLFEKMKARVKIRNDWEMAP